MGNPCRSLHLAARLNKNRCLHAQHLQIPAAGHRVHPLLEAGGLCPVPAVQSGVGVTQVGGAVVRLTQRQALAELLHGLLVMRSCKSRGQKETVYFAP